MAPIVTQVVGIVSLHPSVLFSHPRHLPLNESMLRKKAKSMVLLVLLHLL